MHPLSPQIMEAPKELKVLETHDGWSPVVPDFQREKLNLQRYPSKQQRKIRMGGREVAKTESRRRRNSDLDTQDNILAQMVSSFCTHNIGKCSRHPMCTVHGLTESTMLERSTTKTMQRNSKCRYIK